MLPVARLIKVGSNPEFDYDEYVPITVTWPEYHRTLDKPIYARFVADGSYLELKFDPTIGGLIEAVLVSAEVGVVDGSADLASPTARSVVPALDPESAWSARDDELTGNYLEITVYDDALVIRTSIQPATTWAECGGVRFGLSEGNELAAFVIQWTAEQRAGFMDSCVSRGK